jgi:hypothetical protein
MAFNNTVSIMWIIATMDSWFGFLVFNATFNNISVISWWSVLLVDQTRVPGENHRPVASHWILEISLRNKKIKIGRPHISKMLIAKTKIYVYFYFCLLECISPPSYTAPPTKGHPSYLARFQMHWNIKILLNCTYLSYAPLFHCREVDLRRGGLL